MGFKFEKQEFRQHYEHAEVLVRMIQGLRKTL